MRTFVFGLLVFWMSFPASNVAFGQEVETAPAPEAETAPASPAESAPPPEGVPTDSAVKTLPDIPPEKLEVVKERYPDGKIRVERHAFQDEKGNYVKHGLWTMWYPDGRKIGSGSFFHGKRHGKWTRWFAPGEGELFQSPLYRGYRGPYLSEAIFEHGQLHGPWIILDSEKTKISEWHFQQGKQHGPWIWWYPSGQKRREAIYAGGTLNGVVREWDPMGKLVADEKYIDGRKRYQKVWWFSPGQKEAEGWYLSGKPLLKTRYDWWEGFARTDPVGPVPPDIKVGKWTWWYPNGQKSVEGDFHDGARAGKWTWWGPEGTVRTVKDFPAPQAPPQQKP